MYQKLLALEEDIFKVIANQKRLEIIQLLQKRELNVTEMTEMLGLRQANLSQHLTLLRQHRLVNVTRRGREAYYSLADKNISRAVDLIYRFLQSQHAVDIAPERLFPIVVDPVCGMRLSASEAFDSHDYEGQTYFFCASGCKRQFVKRPKRFTNYKQGVI